MEVILDSIKFEDKAVTDIVNKIFTSFIFRVGCPIVIYEN